VLDSQRSLFTRADEQLRNQGRHVSSVIALYKGLGGGWTDSRIQEMVPQDTRDTMKKRTDWGDLLDDPLPEKYPSQRTSIFGGSNK
jgi:hypothetical protein